MNNKEKLLFTCKEIESYIENGNGTDELQAYLDKRDIFYQGALDERRQEKERYEELIADKDRQLQILESSYELLKNSGWWKLKETMAGKDVLSVEQSQFFEQMDWLADFLNSNRCLEEKEKFFICLKQLCGLSAKVGAYTHEMDIWNRVNKVDGMRFYFPTQFEETQTDKGNILLITHELSRTGAPIVLQDAATELKKAGYFVLMVSPMDGPLRAELCEAGIPVMVDCRLRIGEFKTKEEWTELERQQIEKSWTTDLLVDCFDMTIVCTAVLHNLIDRYAHVDKPMIWWLHEGSASFEQFGRCLSKTLPKHVHVAFVCKYVKEQLEQCGIHYEGEVLSYGVADVPQMTDRRKEDVVTFVSVGSINERKGQDILLDAIGLLSVDCMKKSRFLFVGSPIPGPITDQLEMLSQGYDNLTMTGLIPRDEVLKVYEECDCIICSSRDDPLPVVLTEMMIQRKLCLCSDHTGTAHYLQDGKNGFVFESGNVEQLAQKIEYIVAHRTEMDEIAMEGRKLYDQYFSMNIFRENLLKMVEKVKESSYEC